MSTVTVVIPTYNRGRQLVEVLHHVLKNDTAGFDLIELLVIDDSSAIPAENFIDKSIVHFPFRLEFIVQPNAGPAAARNNGLARAKGEVVIFIDDDVLIESRTIQQHYAAHQQYPDAVVYGNYPYVLPAKPSPVYRYMKKLLDDGLKQIVTANPNQQLVKVESVASGNLSVPKNLFSGTNSLYDTSLSIPAAEEYDLMFSLKQKNIPVYFGIGVMNAWHLQPVTIKDKCIQEFKYGTGIAEVCIKKPEVLALKQVNNIYESNRSLRKTDSKQLKSKKLLKSIFASPLCRAGILLVIKIVEKTAPFDKFLFPMYRFATATYLIAGIRNGEKTYGKEKIF